LQEQVGAGDVLAACVEGGAGVDDDGEEVGVRVCGDAAEVVDGVVGYVCEFDDFCADAVGVVDCD
jgi:hypothetical protein